MQYDAFFTQTITLYHPCIDPVTHEDRYHCAHISGVMVQSKSERSYASNGVATYTDIITVTIPKKADANTPIHLGDFMLIGEGKDITDTYPLQHLRRDHPDLCEVKSVADHQQKPYLKHRKVVCS